MALTTSHWPADTSVPVLAQTVGGLLREAAAEEGDKQALISVAPDRAARTWTYRELLSDAEHAAAWLLDRFEPGEAVVVWAPNVPEWVVLQYGAALAGLVLVTANPALRGPELAHVLNSSGATAVFFVGSFRGTDMAGLVDAVLPGAPGVRESVTLEGWLDEVRATARRSALPDVDPESATQIQFTSGTTGPAKPAVLSHLAMVTNAAYVRARCGAPFGATYVTALPLFHTAGCGLAGLGSVHQRATLVLGELFDPATLIAAIAEYRGVAFGGVPAMLHAMLAYPASAETDLSSLEVIMTGGDAVPPALIDGWTRRYGVRASAVYGQTELSPIICQTSPDDDRADNLGTAGRPLPNVEVAIVVPGTAQITPVGVEGEICARGYQAMQGYLGLPEETARTIDADGWVHTGDLGTMDARGYVTVTGRLKNLIIRGGENIHPREVEEALIEHPAIANATIVGLPDPAWGETVAAVLQLDPERPAPSADDLRTFVRERLSPQKTPTSWYVTGDLPVNAMGKLQRFRLREHIDAGRLSPLT
ncbi:class I adenylate-forming enzyme family protein [Gordonia aichiensis]|uniref:class I adenylate-forming enzyme family protein n=1 Tax=Gordonia aichiensis TaxID=36820 RepID=UPI0032648450